MIKVVENSVLSGNNIREGDVIIRAEGEDLKAIPDLMRIYQGNIWKGVLNLIIFRNQEEKEVRLRLKK